MDDLLVSSSLSLELYPSSAISLTTTGDLMISTVSESTSVLKNIINLIKLESLYELFNLYSVELFYFETMTTVDDFVL